MTKKFLKLTDITEIYNISPMTLWRWRKKAKHSNDPFPNPVRDRVSAKLFRTDEVDAWIERNISTI
ncbi:hypothetical protein P9057_08555 [Gallibacterium anatis]